jgi:hypothetical protein
VPSKPSRQSIPRWHVESGTPGAVRAASAKVIPFPAGRGVTTYPRALVLPERAQPAVAVTTRMILLAGLAGVLAFLAGVATGLLF